MKISELQAGQGKVEITVKVVEKSSPRDFEKFGKKGKVSNAKVKDDSGEMTLSLWNEDVDRISVGDMVKISNGYVSEWKGEKQLSTGKFGTLEKLSKVENKDKEDDLEEIGKELKELEDEEKELEELDKLEDEGSLAEEEIEEGLEDEEEKEIEDDLKKVKKIISIDDIDDDYDSSLEEEVKDE